MKELTTLLIYVPCNFVLLIIALIYAGNAPSDVTLLESRVAALEKTITGDRAEWKEHFDQWKAERESARNDLAIQKWGMHWRTPDGEAIPLYQNKLWAEPVDPPKK